MRKHTLRALAVAMSTTGLLALPAGLGGQAAVAGPNCSHLNHTHRHWHGWNPHTHHWTWAFEGYGSNGAHYEFFYFEEGDYFQSSSNCADAENLAVENVVVDTVLEDAEVVREIIRNG